MRMLLLRIRGVTGYAFLCVPARLDKVLHDHSQRDGGVGASMVRIRRSQGCLIDPGGSEAGRQQNFGGLVLGCIDADFCK